MVGALGMLPRPLADRTGKRVCPCHPANLIKIGAKVVRHAKYVTFQMTDVAVPRELFGAILERIQRFGVPPPLVQRE